MKLGEARDEGKENGESMYRRITFTPPSFRTLNIFRVLIRTIYIYLYYSAFITAAIPSSRFHLLPLSSFAFPISHLEFQPRADAMRYPPTRKENRTLRGSRKFITNYLLSYSDLFSPRSSSHPDLPHRPRIWTRVILYSRETVKRTIWIPGNVLEIRQGAYTNEIRRFKFNPL